MQPHPGMIPPGAKEILSKQYQMVIQCIRGCIPGLVIQARPQIGSGKNAFGFCSQCMTAWEVDPQGNLVSAKQPVLKDVLIQVKRELKKMESQK